MSKHRFQEGLYFKEQHEYVIDLFTLDKSALSFGEQEKGAFEEGTLQQFRLKAFAFLMAMFLLGFMLDIRLPGWLELVALAAVCFLMVDVVIRVVSGFNEESRKAAFTGMLKYVLLLAGIIVVVGYVG
jgi:hypothetical protein